MKGIAITLVLFFIIVISYGCKKAPIDVTCTDSINSLKITKKAFSVKCPADCATGMVWGTDVYTTDSSICLAAVHAGVITKTGGVVKVRIKKGLPAYTGSEKNGVKSSGWGAFDKSFVVKK